MILRGRSLAQGSCRLTLQHRGPYLGQHAVEPTQRALWHSSHGESAVARYRLMVVGVGARVLVVVGTPHA